MASFTDSPKDYNFNPYIQEVPTQALTNVGLWKQDQYNQGLQRIQGSFDQIMGLDIALPETKDYIQGKLSQLRGQLSSSITGDFSDNRLVNQVMGMAGKIAGDPVVQNGVASTATYKKGLQDIQEARKAGKSSIINESYYQDQAQRWLNSRDIHQSFSASFTPYRDVGKKLVDAAEKFENHAPETKTDSPFKRDASGTLIKDRNGNPIVDDAIMEQSIKGLSSGELLKKFQGVLDADDINQLHMEGWYHYRGLDQRGMAAQVDHKYQGEEQFYHQNLVQSEVQLATQKLSPTEKKKLQATIQQYSGQLNALGSLHQQELGELASSDLDSFKSKFYIDKYLKETAQDLANQSVSYEYKTNPYAEMSMQRKRLQAEYDRMGMEDRHFQATYSQRERELALKDQERKDKLGLTPVVMGKGVATNIALPTLETLDQQISGYTDQLKALDRQYAPLLAKGKDGATAKEILDGLMQKYLTNPNIQTNDNNLLSYLQSRDGLEKDRAFKTNLVKNTKQLFDQQYQENLTALFKQGAPNVSVNGKEVVSTEDLAKISEAASHYYSSSYPGGGSGGFGGFGVSPASRDFDGQGFLNQFKNTRLEPLARAYVKNYNNQPLSGGEKAIIQSLQAYRKDWEGKAHALIGEKQAGISNFLLKNLPEYQVATGTLSPKNEKDMERVQQVIGEADSRYVDNGGALDTKRKADYNPTKMVKWLGKDKEATHYTLERNQDGSGQLVITNGGEKMYIPLDAERMQGHFPNYSFGHALDDVNSRILLSPQRTTNINEKGDPVNAYFTGFDFPLLNTTPEVAKNLRFDVEGNPNQKNQFQLRMYYNNNGTWEDHLVNNRGWTSLDGILGAIRTMGTAKVNEILHEKAK